MKVLHINQSDVLGGAAIAAYRLHLGLLSQGIDSNMLVGAMKNGNSSVELIPRKYLIEKLLSPLTNRLGLNYINIVGSFLIQKHDFYRKADVINFHNLHSQYFNYLAIPLLVRSKPAIFTLHDMWAFTGHCAYSFDCNRWEIGCGQCPYPDTYPAIKRDSTRIEWKLKNWIYSRSNLTIVTPSNWLKEHVNRSMLSGFPIHHIPNGIDTNSYQPLDPEMCRNVLGIPPGKRVIMFAAQSLRDPRKGFDLLLKALLNLPSSIRSEIILLSIGDESESFTYPDVISTLRLGYINNDRLKSIAYSCSELFIHTALEDNLPLVIQESMACGTPVVSFKVGGIPELVRPGITGYLVEPKNTYAISKGIIELLENRRLLDRMRATCRSVILQEYSSELQLNRYNNLYKEVVKNY